MIKATELIKKEINDGITVLWENPYFEIEQNNCYNISKQGGIFPQSYMLQVQYSFAWIPFIFKF